MNIRKRIMRTAEQATSAEIVASIDDLLKQILLCLPIRSLIRFKSVSKHWLSLISNPRFAILRSHNPKPALGLFLCNTRGDIPNFEFVNFDVHNPITSPFSTFKFTKDPSAEAINIVQSCNGLLLCSSFQSRSPRKKYYHVFNPTTKQLTTLPKPCGMTVHGIGLAFDPVKSPAHKVVCIRESNLVSGSYQIEIYSSEFGRWRVSGKPFTANHDFKNGVYWNGAIHWLCNWRYDNFLYFNVDEERLGEMPPLYTSECGSGEVTYFGESCDHLHLIEIYGRPEIEFHVHEMKRDYSGWFVKYYVDLSEVTGAFPAMIRDKVNSWEFGYYVLSVLSVIRGAEEEDAFLVLQIPGKAIRYNLVTKSFQKLCDFQGAEEEECWLRFDDFCAHQYIQSLSCV